MSILWSLFMDLLVGVFKKMFTKNRDQELGELRVTTTDQAEVISDVQKAQNARRGDTDALDNELRRD